MAGGEHPSILLVEADPTEADLVLLVFGENELGEAVRVARTVDEAAELLFEDEPAMPPRLILLGLTNRGERELQLARRLKTDWRTSTIPLVVVTSADADHGPSEWASLGVSSFVIRPVDFQKLVEAAGTLSLWWRAFAHGDRRPSFEG
jgi:DNA-binding response OmpR family regulator